MSAFHHHRGGIPALLMAFKLWKTVGWDGRAIAKLLQIE